MTDINVAVTQRVPRDRYERLQRLSERFVDQLNTEDQEFFEKHIESIIPVMNDQLWNFKKTGEMIEMGGKYNMIEINVHKFPVLSDDAIVGLLAHEFAHAKDVEEGLPSFLHSILDWTVENDVFGKREEIYQWNENRIDQKVKEMGFQQEIEALRQENRTYDFRMENYFEPDDVEHPQVKILELECSECGQVYGGKYHFNDFNPNPRLDKDIICNIELHTNGVYRGVYRSDVSIQPSTFTEKIKCFECEEDSLELVSVSN